MFVFKHDTRFQALITTVYVGPWCARSDVLHAKMTTVSTGTCIVLLMTAMMLIIFLAPVQITNIFRYV